MPTKPKQLHVMLDLETLATTPDAAVVSIGAVAFSPQNRGDGLEPDAPFSLALNLREQLEKLSRRVSGDTVAWWMQQSDAARKVFASDQQIHVVPALGLLNEWLPKTEFCLWSNGADFDIPILLSLYRSVDAAPPWKFYHHRCFRTLKELYPKAYEQARKKHVNPTKHDALADAAHQARLAVDILRKAA